MIDFKRLDNENEEQFIWRLCQAKDSGALDMDWREIGDIINKEFRDDETEYRTESAYRKQYQNAKRFYESGVFAQYSDENSYIDEMIEAKHDLRKEKQKLFDERTALNKTLRENARAEENLAKLEELIRESGERKFAYTYTDNAYCNDKDLVICLSDFHLGLSNDNYFGTFNSDVAAERLDAYLESIIKIKNIHRAENAYVLLLGDQINGRIHLTTQLENRENVIDQVERSAELISEFVYEISKEFNTVYVNHVSGNHSRLSMKKDSVLRGERLDDIIPWYMKASLSHIKNVLFIDNGNYDATIGYFNARSNDYLIVHGDFDAFNQSGVSKLVLMTKSNPTAIFYGHKHTCSFDEIADIKIIRSGSFAGTSDDYTISKRIYGTPSQMVCVISNDGVETLYPVRL